MYKFFSLPLLTVSVPAGDNPVPVFQASSFTINVTANQPVNIDCDSNQAQIRVLREVARVAEANLNKLKGSRKSDQPQDEEHNKRLLDFKLTPLGVGVEVAIREYAEYYCKHPEKMPKPEEQISPMV
jgi:hypothetical protein